MYLSALKLSRTPRHFGLPCHFSPHHGELAGWSIFIFIPIGHVLVDEVNVTPHCYLCTHNPKDFYFIYGLF